MGDPRKTRAKYQGPRHPWNKERIESEKKLAYEYGLTNKKELWKVESKLKNYKDNIKKLIAQTGPQAEKELEQLYTKLKNYGIIGHDAGADDVLGLGSEEILGRRLQTLVLKHEMAHTAKQARQFITHGHILVGGRKMTVPGYIVPLTEETTIEFNTKSSLYSPDHPERVVPQATGAGKKDEAKTEKEKAQEPAPVTETEKTQEEEKPVEEKIEEETDNAAEVAEAVEEAEAESIAEDHETEVKKAANAEEEAAEEEKKEDAQ